MTKPSTVPYAHEPGLIARLLGVALEAAHAYGVMLLRICRIVYHSHLSIAKIRGGHPVETIFHAVV